MSKYNSFLGYSSFSVGNVKGATSLADLTLAFATESLIEWQNRSGHVRDICSDPYAPVRKGIYYPNGNAPATKLAQLKLNYFEDGMYRVLGRKAADNTIYGDDAFPVVYSSYSYNSNNAWVDRWNHNASRMSLGRPAKLTEKLNVLGEMMPHWVALRTSLAKARVTSDAAAARAASNDRHDAISEKYGENVSRIFGELDRAIAAVKAPSGAAKPVQATRSGSGVRPRLWGISEQEALRC